MTAIIESPQVDTNEILRVATKMNAELERLSILQHVAVVNILLQLTQHRGNALDAKLQAKENRLDEQEPLAPHLIRKQ